MLTETITFTNFDGKQVTETHYFNLTRAELVRWEMEHQEGVGEMFLRISQSNDKVALGKAFHDFLSRTYGLKSEDGNHHIKSPEITAKFEHSAAFDEFYMKLFTDADFALQFIKGVLPKEVVSDEMVEEVFKTGEQKARDVVSSLAPPPPPPPPVLTPDQIQTGNEIIRSQG